MNDLKIQITENGLSKIDGASEPDFLDIGLKLSSMETGLQWAIGDWYLAIKDVDKKKVCDAVGLNHRSAQLYSYTARAFKIEDRGSGLSFEHYRCLAVNALSDSDRSFLIQEACDGDGEYDANGDKVRWSRKRLLRERNILCRIAPPSSKVEKFTNGVLSLEESVVASLPEGTSKATIKKIITGLRKEAEKLKSEFNAAVEIAAESKSKNQRLNMRAAEKRANDKHEITIKMAAGIKAFMSKGEFNLIRACLHPDVNTSKKANKAFKIFNGLADIKNW